MKKMMLVLLIIAAICEVSMAGSESQMAVVRHGDIFKVIYKSPYLSCVKMSIADKNGLEIFKEELICNQGFIRPYNFSDLPKGDYLIQLSDGSEKKTEKIHFDDQPWLAHLMQLNSEEKKVLVAIPYQNACDLTIEIVDDQEQIIYKKNQKIDSPYAQVFKLENVNGAATINVFNQSTGESKSLTIK
jgi:hypothetical protein